MKTEPFTTITPADERRLIKAARDRRLLRRLELARLIVRAEQQLPARFFLVSTDGDCREVRP